MTFADTFRLGLAGFWRRLLAALIDSAIVLIPLQLVVAVLFITTNGRIQGDFGFATSVCTEVAIPAVIDPPPPPDSNYAIRCDSSLFGLRTSSVLHVGVETASANMTTRTEVTYRLDGNGLPYPAARDVSFWAGLALFIYLVLMETAFGAGVGKQIVGLKVIDRQNSRDRGLSLGKALLRNAFMYTGAVPVVAVLLFASSTADPLGAMASSGFWTAFAVAAALEVAWIIWILVSLIAKRDPIYDRLAKTSVVRLK